ncbi:MAG TPA: glycosyl hydrolase, partial [Phycisphaerales bacterium]|nr:glycosyl hydrolase [Phycisphaerales bacterium]
MIGRPEAKASIRPIDVTVSPFTRLKTISGAQVRLRQGLWHQRMMTNHQVSLKHGFEMLAEGGNLHNLGMAGRTVIGEYHQRLASDSDVYKWVEAVAYFLATSEDQTIKDMLDQVIDLIVNAQDDDGYLMSYYQVQIPDSRWKDLAKGHELYCAGHLIQAAIAHHAATADDRLLNVANRLVDHIVGLFGVNRQEGTTGHPGIETALIELYRYTRRDDCLELAEFFLKQRGKYQFEGLDQQWVFQNHAPIEEQTTLVGHAVRQMYLVAGITDLYLESGDTRLLKTLMMQWDDMVRGKVYITGGLGQRHYREVFGDSYELPTDRCYCESCAAVGSIMWNWRMLLATGEARFADVIEQTLYNGFLSAGGIDGRHFFYVNPLMSRGQNVVAKNDHSSPWCRKIWHKTACCPPNIMRLLASLSHYLVTTSKDGIQIQQYASCSVQIEKRSIGNIQLDIQTEYPWDGHVSINVNCQSDIPWNLSLRIPSWCDEFDLFLNGQKLESAPEEGYVNVHRLWQAGDTLELKLAMKPVLMIADPRIDAVRGCVAIQRGPVLYCVEQCDCPAGVELQDIAIPCDPDFKTRWQPDLLGGIMTVEFNANLHERSQW